MTTTDAWWVYIIRNERNCLYTGITTDVNRRFKEHVQGLSRASRYLRASRALTLAYKVKAQGRSQALVIEARIKKLKKNRKEEIITKRYRLKRLLDMLRLES